MAGKGKIRKSDGKPQITNSPQRHRDAENLVARMRVEGYERRDIKKAVMEQFGYADSTSDDIIDVTTKRLRDNYEKFKDDVAKTQIEHLIAIQAECWGKEQYNEALKAIEILNKMTGQYQERMKIDATCDSEVEIKFG